MKKSLLQKGEGKHMLISMAKKGKKKVITRATAEDIAYAMEMGQRVRYIRKKKKPKMSIFKLAELCELSDVTVGGVERGEIPLVPYATIKRIAKALGVPTQVITGETDLSKIIEIVENISKHTP